MNRSDAKRTRCRFTPGQASAFRSRETLSLTFPYGTFIIQLTQTFQGVLGVGTYGVGCLLRMPLLRVLFLGHAIYAAFPP